MSNSSIAFRLITLISALAHAASFVTVTPHQHQQHHQHQQAFVRNTIRRKTTTQQNMLPPLDLDHETMMTSSLTSASTFLSTISADIDNISNDDFATVFAGGIFVMFGGVASALIVGFLLESGNSYASVVADSYAQGGDEEFWESLSPEDQVKTRELLDKMKKSKEAREGGGGGGSDGVGSQVDSVPVVTAAAADAAVNAAPVDTSSKSDASPVKSTEKKAEVSMFSDYDD